MKNRFSLSILLLGILPILPILIQPEIYWSFHICIFIMILIEYKVLVKTKAYSYLWLLGLPLVWASIISFNDDLYSIFKALFYLSTPLVFTIIGMQIARIFSPKIILKYIVYSGTIGSLLYLGLSLYTLGIKALVDPYEMRKLVMWGSISNVIAIIIVLFSEKYGIILYKKNFFKFILLSINILGLYLTASRTYYTIFVIFLIVFLYKKNKKTIFIIGGTLFVVFNIVVNLNSDSELVQKIASGGKELQGGNYNTDEEINTMYRGYETFMTLKTYNSGTTLNLIFGHGYAKLVDLETYVLLGDTDFKMIPITHNGYVFQLLREGVFGLILILIFLIKVLRIVPKSNVLYLFHLIKIGVIISLLFSNYLENTFFTIEMLQVWLFMGAFLVYAFKERKLNKTSPSRIPELNT